MMSAKPERRLSAKQVVAILSLAIAPLTVGVATATAQAQSPCIEGNPYQLSETQREACGDHAFPLEKVEPLPGGGDAYLYTVDGVGTTYLVPPASFDAATASQAELERYGIPTAPPTTSPEYALWHKMIEHMVASPPPSGAVVTVPETVAPDQRIGAPSPDTESPNLTPGEPNSGVSANGTEYSENWSGYDNYDKEQFYKESTAYYFQPIAHTTDCSPNAAVFWAGLGGVNNTSRLAQDGTGINTDGLGQYQAWSEVLPEEKSIVVVNPSFYATPEEEFESKVEYKSQTKFGMYMYNFKTGEHRSFTSTVKDESWDGSTSEFIAERPTYDSTELWGKNKDLPGLTNFETVEMEGYSNNEPLDTYGHNALIMKESLLDDLTLAEPGAIEGKAFFTDYHKHCN
jgi:hypothetical protein